MPFNTALSAGNYTTLRKLGANNTPAYRGALYMAVNPNTVVYSARVNQTTFASSFVEITYDGGSGTLADVRVDMRIIISHTSNQKDAFFDGRIRAVPTSTIFKINETSAAVQDNDYIWVIDDYPIRDKLGRDVNGTAYKDFDITFRQLPPVVWGILPVYCDWVDAAISNKYRVVLAPQATAGTDGASISSWSWSIADGTFFSGNASSQNVTIDFPYGFRNIHLTVTPSTGPALTLHIAIWAFDRTNYPPQLLHARDVQTSKSLGAGVEASAVAFGQVSGLLDNTLVVGWNDELYEDGSKNIAGDNIAFMGRIRRTNDSARPSEAVGIEAETRLTFETPMNQLARIEQLSYDLLNSTSPTVFNQIKAITPWRAILFILFECTTFLNVHPLRFDSTSNTFEVVGMGVQGGNILAAVNALAQDINAALQMNAAGQAEVVREGIMLPVGTERNALPTVANWTNADLFMIEDYQHDQARTVGKLSASGGFYNSGSQSVETLKSIAPGIAQDSAEGTTTLERQILAANSGAGAAQIELDGRAGHALEKAQDADRMTVIHPPGYHWLTPARDQWYTFTLDGSETVRGIVLTTATRWWLESVSVAHNSVTGTKDVRAVYVKETSGSPGQAPPKIAQTEYENPQAQYPFIDFYPGFGGQPVWVSDNPGGLTLPIYTGPSPISPQTLVIPADGNTIIYSADDNRLRVTTEFIQRTAPAWRDITPPLSAGEVIQHAIFTNFGRECYCLVNDGTNSRVYYAADGVTGKPTWVANPTVTGVFDYIEATDVRGKIYISGKKASTTIGAWTHTFDYTLGYQGWSIIEGSYGGGLFHSAQHTSSGFQAWGYQETLAIFDTVIAAIQSPIWSPAFDVNQIDVEYNTSLSPGAHIQTINRIEAVLNGVTTRNFQPLTTGTATATFGSATGLFRLFFRLLQRDGTNAMLSGDGYVSSYLRKVIIGNSTGVNPFARDHQTAYSTDYGASFATPVIAGVAPNMPGTSVSKVGSQILASKSDRVRKATDGGAYSDYGGVKAQGPILVPRWVLGSTSSPNNGSNPEYVLFGAEVDTGETMWKVTSSGGTFTNITPTSGGYKGFAVAHGGIDMPWRSGAIILAIGQFNTERKLAVSVNTGSSWAFSAALDTAANWVRTRRGDINNKQAFIANGEELGYCPNYQAATPVIQARKVPSTGQIKFVEVLG